MSERSISVAFEGIWDKFGNSVNSGAGKLAKDAIHM